MSKSDFCYGQPRFENDHIILEKFDTSLHVSKFVQVMNSHPKFMEYTPLPKLATEEHFKTAFFEPYIETPASSCAWAIYDKVKGGGETTDETYAGVIALTSTSKDDAVSEVGIFIFPDFQRTHVASNAIGTILLWLLDPPSSGGLGLRRVEWQCHSENTASRRAAERMGFVYEGTKRWHATLVEGKTGASAEALRKRNGTKEEMVGRHSAQFSIVWDEWDDKRANVVALMERRK